VDPAEDELFSECDVAVCPSICECTLTSCALPALNCQFNPACRAFAECTLTCGCDDTPCAETCAADHDSTQTVKLLECMVDKCESRHRDEHAVSKAVEQSVVERAEEQQLPDCATAACPSICDCTLVSCALPALNCQFNAACREFAECSLTCGCGDTPCAETCAAEHDSTQTVKLLECMINNCDARQRDVHALSQTAEQAVIEHAEEKQLPDCATAACPSICDCTLVSCALPALNCQFNAACREFAECSLTCGCGDTPCAETCAAEHDSTQTVKLLECMINNCDARQRDINVVSEATEHAVVNFEKEEQLPDCATAACPSICDCTIVSCALPALNCQFNAACREFAECSLTCGCGDTACAETCAAEHDSTQTVKMLECMINNCDARQRDTHAISEASEQAIVEDAKVEQLPDCATAACPSICDCTLVSCALPALNCQFNAACREFAECSLTCGCGDTPCAETCAAEHDSTQTVKLLECMINNCDALI